MHLKQLISILFYFLAGLCLPSWVMASADAKDDPIEVSKKIIMDDPLPWNAEEYQAIRNELGPARSLKEMEKNYLLLQSPWLGTDYLQGVFDEGVNTIPVEQLLDLLNLAANSPGQTSRKLAEISLQQAMIEYEKAFTIASNLKSDESVAYEEAIHFLQNRFGYLKIKTARNLLEESRGEENPGVDKQTSKKIADRFKGLRKKYSEEIPLTHALDEIKAFYTLLEEVVSGLATVKSYTDFTQTITELNEVQLKERKHWRSDLKITYPGKGSVWTIPDEVSIQWNTENLPADKTIKFYLLKNNTVIQELGVFQNNSVAEGIKLNKTLPKGSNYRIMGIELFPADKFHTAKFATPFFTIDKRDPSIPPPVAEEVVIEQEPQPADESVVVRIEEKEETSTTVPEVVEESSPEEEIDEDQKEIVDVEQPPVVEKEIPEAREVEKRTDFDGRSITYVQELVVSSEIIQINLWDHGRQDGDIVSIYLNGYPIVSQHNLTYQKKGFELKLDASQPNDLFLYAHNLGRFPPNTVSIEIIDGENSENIVLNSDLSRCEAVLISVKD